MDRTHNPTQNWSQGMTSDPVSVATTYSKGEILEMVRDALVHDRAFLVYQPIVTGDSAHKAAFYEGLIRITDQTGRVIPAAEFINDVEETELGREIDCIALRHGLRALHEFPTLRLSVNMSARSIGYSKWNEEMDRGIHRDPTVAERLILELTERSAMDLPDIVCSFMEAQQRKGISFAIDDFGAGQTSLRYLRDFYFDFLKIDGEFVKGVSVDPDNQVLVSALVAIARQFDMLVIAEKVETARDAKFLEGIGVDFMQGYYWGAPSKSATWLLSESSKDALRHTA